jgi:hypothetical protein
VPVHQRGKRIVRTLPGIGLKQRLVILVH